MLLLPLLLKLCQFMLLDQGLELWVLLPLEMERILTMDQLLDQLLVHDITLTNISP
jgi:hypothetical protein